MKDFNHSVIPLLCDFEWVVVFLSVMQKRGIPDMYLATYNPTALFSD